jgi:protein arginine kinase activator
MICQNCQKRSATVHMTEILPTGDKRERHLCETCASEQGLVQKSAVSLDELLQTFEQAQQKARGMADLVCPQCGITFVEFRHQGLLGCPHDYEAFAKPLQRLLKQAHAGGAQHVGKAPHQAAERVRKQHDLVRLRRDLDAAVKAEDYERAAKLRDQIAALEKP